MIVNIGNGLRERHLRVRLTAGLYKGADATYAVPEDFDEIHKVQPEVGIYIEVLLRKLALQRKAIEDAPHPDLCAAWMADNDTNGRWFEVEYCDCWKREALSNGD